jgi:hypothetical protein
MTQKQDRGLMVAILFLEQRTNNGYLSCNFDRFGAMRFSLGGAQVKDTIADAGLCPGWIQRGRQGNYQRSDSVMQDIC